MEEDEIQPEDRWEGMLLAYDFVLPSYDWAMQRLNAVEGRIQSLMMFSVSLAVTGPVLVASLVDEVRLGSGWFVAALVTALGILVGGTVTRAWGGIRLLNIGVVHDDWYSDSELEFKHRAAYWAGRHYAHNTKVVNRKGGTALVLTAAFLIEAALMLVWALGEAVAS